eukprot:7862-Heterococcus_DN1.PRE.1
MCDCVCCAATKHSQAQLDNFDDDLPLHSLVMFRRMAEAQAHKEKLTQRQQAAAAAATATAAAAKDSQQAQTATAATAAKPATADTSSTGSTAPTATAAAAAKPAVAVTKSWFGSMFSKKKAAGTGTGGGGATAGAGDSSGDEAEEGDVVLDDLVTDAIQDEAETAQQRAAALAPEYALYKITASLSGALGIAGHASQPLVEAGLAFTAGATVLQSSAISASFELSRLEVLDRYSSNPLFPRLIAVAADVSTAAGASPPTSKSDSPLLQETVEKRGNAGSALLKLVPPQDRSPTAASKGAKSGSSRSKGSSVVSVTAAVGEHESSLQLKALPLVVVYNREVRSVCTAANFAYIMHHQCIMLACANTAAAAAGTTDCMYNINDTMATNRGADLSAAAGQAAYKRLEEARAQAAVYLQKTKALKVEVDAAAPKVIVPMASTTSSSGSSSDSSGYLLLDCGHMIVKGGTELNGQTRDDKQPMWDVSLSDISSVNRVHRCNAAMHQQYLQEDKHWRSTSYCVTGVLPLSLPASKSAAGKLSSSSGDALIEPFGITVTVNVDNPVDTVATTTTATSSTAVAPDLSLVVAVHPRIKGLMSPRKIEQLFAVLDYVTGADTDISTVCSYMVAVAMQASVLLLAALDTALPDVNDTDSAIAAGAVSDLTALPATPEALLESDDVSDDVSTLSGESLTNQNLNPERRVMVAQVQVLSVELALVADPVEHETGAARELLYLKLAGLALQVEKRPFDLAVTVGLSELSLEDMSRPADSGLRRMAHSSATQSSSSKQHKRSSSSSSGSNSGS